MKTSWIVSAVGGNGKYGRFFESKEHQALLKIHGEGSEKQGSLTYSEVFKPKASKRPKTSDFWFLKSLCHPNSRKKRWFLYDGLYSYQPSTSYSLRSLWIINASNGHEFSSESNVRKRINWLFRTNHEPGRKSINVYATSYVANVRSKLVPKLP